MAGLTEVKANSAFKLGLSLAISGHYVQLQRTGAGHAIRSDQYLYNSKATQAILCSLGAKHSLFDKEVPTLFCLQLTRAECVPDNESSPPCHPQP